MAVAEAKGIQSELLPRIATGFCSGTSRTAGVCGAVSGAILGLNLLTGRTAPGQPVDENYALVQRFVVAFEAKYGSINCQQLIGYHLGTEEGRAAFAENDLIELCLQYTAEATRMALSLLQE